MIYTDLYIFASDNPADGFKELHDFAASVGYDKGWHYNHCGTPYYQCRKRMLVLRTLAKIRAPIVSRATMKEVLRHNKARINIRTDFKLFSIRKLSAYMLSDICVSNRIEIDFGHILIKSTEAWCITRYEFQDTKIVFTLNYEYPLGKVVMNNDTELKIPESVIQKIKDNTRPMSMTSNRTKIKNKS